MSQPKKTPEQLLATTRALPTELDMGRISQIVNQFPPDSEPPAGFGHAPKILLLMLFLSTFVAGLYFLAGPTAIKADVQLSGVFPAESPVATIDTPPSLGDPETPAPALRPTQPAVSVATIQAAPDITAVDPAPFTSPDVPDPAPAAAPPTVNEEAPEPVVTPPSRSLARPSRYLATGPQDDPIEGQFTMDKKKLTLYKSIRIRGRKVTWVLPINLAADELATLEKEGYVERETGRLSLTDERTGFTEGSFEFQPRSEVRAGYEQRGWGTSQAPAEAINMTGIVKGLPMVNPVYTEEPAELLWLRYFICDVDNGYLGILKDLGFSERSFTELWKLPNADLNKTKLLKLANDVRRLSPLYRGTDLDELLAYHDGRRLLDGLYEIGYRDVSPTEIKQLNDLKVYPRYVRAINRGSHGPEPLANIVRYRDAGVYEGYPGEIKAAFGRELMPEEILRLFEAKLFPANLARLQRDGFRDLSLAEYIELHQAPRKAAEKLLTDSDGRLVDINFARGGRVKKTETKRLPKFKTLVVDRDIHVVVIPDDRNRAELGYLLDTDWVRFKIKTNRRGRLTIRKKSKFGTSITGMVQAEVRLYASDLQKIVVDERSRVFIVGDPAEYQTSGPVGTAVLVE